MLNISFKKRILQNQTLQKCLIFKMPFLNEQLLEDCWAAPDSLRNSPLLNMQIKNLGLLSSPLYDDVGHQKLKKQNKSNKIKSLKKKWVHHLLALYLMGKFTTTKIWYGIFDFRL